MRSSWLSFGFVVLVGATFGCSANGSSPQSSGGNGGTGAGTGGGSGFGGVSGSGGSLGGFGGCNGSRCSSDLHSVVDCDGNVLSTCPPEKGCSNGSCVPACQSAGDNRSTYGCEFYLVQPDMAASARAACFAAFVVNTWTDPVGVAIEYGGNPLDPRQFGYLPKGTGVSLTYQPLTDGRIPPGEVAIFFLSNVRRPPLGLDFNCPAGVNVALAADGALHGTGIGKSFRIATGAPVVAYDMYPFGGGRSAITSATLLLPTSAWGVNYMGVDAFGIGNIVQRPVLALVSQKDGTSITFNPNNNINPLGGVAAATKYTPFTFTLNRGQVYQVTQGPSLVGSAISSTEPIGMWAGKDALGIDACCDESSHQQVPPVKAFGSEYAAVRYRDRYDDHVESPPWRIIGAVDGTQLTYDPAPPTGAPGTLNRGQVAEFHTSDVFLVRSQDPQHPFYMSAHMTGGGLYDPDPEDAQGNADGRGDAEYVNVVPTGEYLDKYIFFTDPTYPETNLVVVRKAGSGEFGFADVELDCAGALTGWQPIGHSGNYEYTRFDISRHNFQGQGNCDNGRHVISSKVPFALTVWGWGSAETGGSASGSYSQYVSYAYPAGAGVAPINDVVIDPVH